LSQKKKILFTFGGLPHYYNLVLNRLHAHPDNSIVVITPQQNGATLGKGVHQTNQSIQFKLIQLQEYKALWGKSFFKDFYKTIADEKPDILVTIWPYFLAFVYKPLLYYKIKKLGVKIILKEIPFNIPKKEDFYGFFAAGVAQDSNLEPKPQRKTLAFYLKYALLKWTYTVAFNKVNAHVDYSPEAYPIFGSYGVPAERIFIIYNSPDTDEILAVKKQLLSENALQIIPYSLIHVGRLVNWKRVDMLVDAVQQLKTKYPNISLKIVGDGPEKKFLEQKVQNLNLQDKIQFVGAVYNMATLGQHLLSAQIYTLAGMGGLSINDAMCFDKPIVCSRADGTEKTLVRDGYNGYIFKNNDLADLINKLDLLWQNPDTLAQMGANSGKIIANEINIHTVVANYQKAFQYCS
jgi:glycosyltransferase involved in cell wall biosynthesis